MWWQVGSWGPGAHGLAASALVGAATLGWAWWSTRGKRRDRRWWWAPLGASLGWPGAALLLWATEAPHGPLGASPAWYVAALALVGVVATHALHRRAKTGRHLHWAWPLPACVVLLCGVLFAPRLSLLAVPYPVWDPWAHLTATVQWARMADVAAMLVLWWATLAAASGSGAPRTHSTRARIAVAVLGIACAMALLVTWATMPRIAGYGNEMAAVTFCGCMLVSGWAYARTIRFDGPPGRPWLIAALGVLGLALGMLAWMEEEVVVLLMGGGPATVGALPLHEHAVPPLVGAFMVVAGLAIALASRRAAPVDGPPRPTGMRHAAAWLVVLGAIAAAQLPLGTRAVEVLALWSPGVELAQPCKLSSWRAYVDAGGSLHAAPLVETSATSAVVSMYPHFLARPPFRASRAIHTLPPPSGLEAWQAELRSSIGTYVRSVRIVAQRESLKTLEIGASEVPEVDIPVILGLDPTTPFNIARAIVAAATDAGAARIDWWLPDERDAARCAVATVASTLPYLVPSRLGERGALTSPGWVGHVDTAPYWVHEARVRVEHDGLVIATKAPYEPVARMSPVEGCPSDGPTLCLRGDAPSPRAAFAQARTLARGGRVDESRQHLERALDAYDFDALPALLSPSEDAWFSANALNLVVEAADDVPVAAVTRLIAMYGETWRPSEAKADETTDGLARYVTVNPSAVSR